MSEVFFTDRDLGRQFPGILSAAGLKVERHADHFAHDCPDAEWLEAVAKYGWVALTHDGRIRYKPNELAAVIAHKAQLLVIVGNAPYAQLAHSFVASIDPVRTFLGLHEPPFIGKVYRPTASDVVKNPTAPGHVELWYPKS